MNAFSANSKSIINRDDECLNAYFREVKKYKLLTPEETPEVLQAIKRGGKEGERAKTRLVEANLRFVISVANKFTGHGLSLADLIQEGNIGMLEAAESFNPSYGCKFPTYAVWHIRKAILHALNFYKLVRIPANQQKVLDAFNKSIKGLSAQEVTLAMDTFCDEMGIEISDLLCLMDTEHKMKELDAQISNDDENSIAYTDMLASDCRTDAELDNESMTSDIMYALDHALKPAEKEIILMVYGMGCKELSLTEISQVVEHCYEHVRLTKNHALDKLRESPYSSQLLSYLAA